MKKGAIFLLLFYFFITKASAQSFVDTPEIVTSVSMNIAGKVDSIAELTLAMSAMESGAGLQKTVTSGDSVITVPDTSLLLLEERTLKFNEDGALTEERTGKTNGKTVELKDFTTTTYQYKKGRLIAKVNYRDKALIDSAVYIYQKGRLWKQDIYDNKKKRSGRILYALNPDNKLLTISNKNAQNALVNMTRIKYNENYELVETALHDNTMRLVSTRTYVVERDTADRRHVMIFDFAKPDTATGMVSYLLDDNDNHLEDVVQDEQKNVTYYSTAHYDSLNNLTSQTVFTTEKLQIACKYVYDSNGNWIEKRIYHNDAPHRMMKRTIYYHREAKP